MFKRLFGLREKSNTTKDVELTVLGHKLKDLDMQTVTYHFNDEEISCQIRTGGLGMIHHCFKLENREDAEKFLKAIKSPTNQEGLSNLEKEGLKRARINSTKKYPAYQEQDEQLMIRVSPGQFKFFTEKFGTLNELKDSRPSI